MDSFELIIPGSTSNLGPGFDTLGLALTIYNRLRVARRGKGLKIDIASGVKDIFRKDIVGMVEHTTAAFLRHTGLRKPDAEITFENEVPIARGLGSSATFRMGTLIAMNRLVESPLKLDELISIGCALEKHTENCVASAIGGLTASGFIGDRVAHASFKISEKFSIVAIIPDKPIRTSETRKLLPKSLALADAVANMNRVALLIAALTEGKPEELAGLFDDRIHQPYRAKVITPLFETIEAARKVGAWGGFLSGSGSTIIAIATEKFEVICDAMLEVMKKYKWEAQVKILKPDLDGTRFV